MQRFEILLSACEYSVLYCSCGISLNELYRFDLSSFQRDYIIAHNVLWLVVSSLYKYVGLHFLYQFVGSIFVK